MGITVLCVSAFLSHCLFYTHMQVCTDTCTHTYPSSPLASFLILVASSAALATKTAFLISAWSLYRLVLCHWVLVAVSPQPSPVMAEMPLTFLKMPGVRDFNSFVVLNFPSCLPDLGLILRQSSVFSSSWHKIYLFMLVLHLFPLQMTLLCGIVALSSMVSMFQCWGQSWHSWWQSVLLFFLVCNYKQGLSKISSIYLCMWLNSWPQICLVRKYVLLHFSTDSSYQLMVPNCLGAPLDVISSVVFLCAYVMCVRMACTGQRYPQLLSLGSCLLDRLSQWLLSCLASKPQVSACLGLLVLRLQECATMPVV